VTVDVLTARNDGKNLGIFADENSTTLPLKKEWLQP
jgi:hypothetical protein